MLHLSANFRLKVSLQEVCIATTGSYGLSSSPQLFMFNLGLINSSTPSWGDVWANRRCLWFGHHGRTRYGDSSVQPVIRLRYLVFHLNIYLHTGSCTVRRSNAVPPVRRLDQGPRLWSLRESLGWANTISRDRIIFLVTRPGYMITVGILIHASVKGPFWHLLQWHCDDGSDVVLEARWLWIEACPVVCRCEANEPIFIYWQDVGSYRL